MHGGGGVTNAKPKYLPNASGGYNTSTVQGSIMIELARAIICTLGGQI